MMPPIWTKSISSRSLACWTASPLRPSLVEGPVSAEVAAMAGADVATVPPAVLHQMFHHPLTYSGLERFVRDWETTGQRIL